MERTKKHGTATTIVWLVLMLAALGSFYIIYQLNQTSAAYNAVQSELRKPQYSGSVESVKLEGSDTVVNIPSWALFQNDNTWVLASKARYLPASFTPKELVESPIPHGDSTESMKISSRIALPLTRLVTAARQDGHTLVLSSAYRSISDQQKLLDEFIASKGEQLASEYVAPPGSSEHHTGLAVDFSDAAPSCATDSDKCALSFESASWLAENAYKYGFIERYPEGAKPITGISYEPWHYRYVGVVLAKALHESTLTFDEFIEKTR